MMAGEMLMLNEQNEILKLKKPKEVLAVHFGQREFINSSKGFLEVLKEADDKAILVRWKLKLTAVKNIGAYGTTTESAAIDYVTQIGYSGYIIEGEKLIHPQELNYRVMPDYYLRLDSGLFRITGERDFVRVFGNDKKDIIRAYVKEYKLNFKKLSDILRLFDYLSIDN
jgi:hypothetical protein